MLNFNFALLTTHYGFILNPICNLIFRVWLVKTNFDVNGLRNE